MLSRVSSRDVTEVLLHRSYHVATLDHDAEIIEQLSSEFIERVTGVTRDHRGGSAAGGDVRAKT